MLKRNRHQDLNGNNVKIGDIIYRFSAGWRTNCYEIVTRFTGSHNPCVSRPYPDHQTGKKKLMENGYLTTAPFMIITTPIIDQEDLDLFNEERKNKGLSPLKKYGDT